MQAPGIPSVDQLLVLLTVVEEGSFTAAARRLGRATSAVSLVRADIEAGRLVRLDLPDWRGGEYQMQVVHKIETPPGPAGRWLIERLVALFAEAQAHIVPKAARPTDVKRHRIKGHRQAPRRTTRSRRMSAGRH